MFEFQFNYAGRSSVTLLDSWDKTVQEKTVEYNDPASFLKVSKQQISYPKTNTREWYLEFENCGEQNTPIISNIHPLDIIIDSKRCPFDDGYAPKGSLHTDFILHYAQGGMSGPKDYRPEIQNLGNHTAGCFKLTTSGGRSSNLHMPFFNIQTGENSGMIIAIGWSGQWHCLFDMVGEGQCRIRAGMEKTYFTLYPDEKLRSPSIVIMEWEGDLVDSYNKWRQFLRKNKCLDLDGEAVLPAVWVNSWFTFDCGYGVNEENQKATMTGAGKMGIDHLVIDAGWYKCANPYWWDGIGSWEPRDDTFPNGFSPLKTHGEKEGINLGIWFEPERAAATSILAKEHPNWLMGIDDAFTKTGKTVDVDHVSHLVNLGLPEVQDWFVDLVDQYVKQGMTWFRHDCNINPLEIWQKSDAPDRQGISEIRYIEGLYEIYDEIHRRHPNLIIEGCASGGRRIDIETVKRNHGYWATDMMCGTPEPMQAHILGFNKFLLPHWHNTVLQMKNAPKEDTPANRYNFFSFLGGAPCFCFDMCDESVDFELGKKWLNWFKKHRHLTMGDFYPLTEWNLSKEVWMGYQFHRQDLNKGLIIIFRRPDSPYTSAEFSLRGLQPDATYQFTSVLDDASFAGKGDEMRRGLTVNLTSAPDIALLIYSKS